MKKDCSLTAELQTNEDIYSLNHKNQRSQHRVTLHDELLKRQPAPIQSTTTGILKLKSEPKTSAISPIEWIKSSSCQDM